MTKDNNLLLIIFIGIIIYWIINLNTKKKIKESYTELSSKKNKHIKENKSDSNTNIMNSLYEKFNNQTFSNKPKQIDNSIPYTNTEKDSKLLSLKESSQQSVSKSIMLDNNYNSFINQFSSNKVDTPKSDLNGINNNKQDNFQSLTSNYMLLEENRLPDPKFDKITPQDARKTLTSSELLPKEENKDWFQVPNSKFNLMEAVNLEIPEIKIGIDTVGQSRKNATYDLRTAPPCPKFVVSPWSNSTIEPDYNTKALC